MRLDHHSVANDHEEPSQLPLRTVQNQFCRLGSCPNSAAYSLPLLLLQTPRLQQCVLAHAFTSQNLSLRSPNRTVVYHKLYHKAVGHIPRIQ